MRAQNFEVLSSTPPAAPPADNFSIGGVKLQAPQGTRLVTGQVLDRSGTPLNGVLVVTPGDRTGTITNRDGQYEILLDSTAQKLEFQANGYSSQRIDISDTRDFVRVTLDETAATVDQVIATEASAKKSKSTKVNPTVSASAINLNIAKPEINLQRFERRLQRNLQYPQAAIDQAISGAVTLRFLILPDGRPVDIKAVSGPKELYEEAIRLIREGPKWEITNGGNKSVTFTYRLDFSL
jgi:TonB family protein